MQMKFQTMKKPNELKDRETWLMILLFALIILAVQPCKSQGWDDYCTQPKFKAMYLYGMGHGGGIEIGGKICLVLFQAPHEHVAFRLPDIHAEPRHVVLTFRECFSCLSLNNQQVLPAGC